VTCQSSVFPIGHTEKWLWAAKIARRLTRGISDITFKVTPNFQLVSLEEHETV